MIQSINTLRNSIQSDFRKKNRGESMNYIAAIFCVIALVTINIFGKESNDINSILSAAIMGLVWGGVQRGAAKKGEDDEPPALRRPTKRANPKIDPD